MAETKFDYGKPILIAISSGIIMFLIFGIVTAIIPNSFFIRMTPVTWLEWASLVITSLLLGTYFGLSYYGKKVKSTKCNTTATAGGIFGFLTFGCSICNKILILLLGVSGVLKYFEPVRPALGFLSIGLLGTALVYKAKNIKSKKILNLTFTYLHMPNNNIEKSLKLAILLTSIFFVVEVVGGLISGSLSLLGDAVHMFRDVFALLISLSAINIAKKLPSRTKTFGYHRIEILASLLNGILLFGVSIWIFWEAYQRFFTPKPIESVTMFIVALIGLLVNLYVVSRLHGSHDLNIKSAFVHVLADTFSSIAVIFASIWIFFTNQTAVDPILGSLIAAFILFSAFAIIKDSIHIILGYVPKNVDFDDVIKDVERVKGVDGVHEVHLWTLCSNINVIDAHIFTKEPNMGNIEIMKKKIKKNLEKYSIKHATLEFECEECMRSDKIKKVRH